MVRVQKFFPEPSLTRQEFKEECDLSKLLTRYAPQELLENARGFAAGGHFEDVTFIPDYRSALDAMRLARASFAALPQKIRDRVANDPRILLDFVQDPANENELIALGILSPKPNAVEGSGTLPT